MASTSPLSAGHSGIRIWNRELVAYPERDTRRMHLLLVVLITVTLYYELYVGSGVATIMLAQLRIPFPIFVYILAAGNLLGAFASLLAGLADRFGRANLVVYGLLVVGLITLFWVPNVTNALQFGLSFGVVSFVEGIILVATPALIRDFAPQVGRATAMGFLDHRTGARQLDSERGQHTDAANLSDLAESVRDLRRRRDGGLYARILISA